MQEQVKATFLVNAAVLLEFRGTKLLIDGIYDENGPAAEGDFHAERRLCCLAGVAEKGGGDGDSVCSAASGIMQENRFSPGAGDSYSCLPDQTSG